MNKEDRYCTHLIQSIHFKSWLKTNMVLNVMLITIRYSAVKNVK